MRLFPLLAALLIGASSAQAQVTRVSAPLPTVLTAAMCGIVGDGATDNTTAIQNCLSRASLATGGGQRAVVEFPVGVYAMNVVDTYPGVDIQGPGWGDNSSEGPPTTAYFKPFDVSKPVWQFGDDSAPVEGGVLSNVVVDCAGTGTTGVRFAGGSLRMGVDQVKVYNCTGQGIDFLGGSAFASAQNFVSHSYVRTFTDGAVALRFYDPTASSSVFSNDHFVSDTSLKAGPGGIAVYNDSSSFLSTNLKIDARPGAAVLVKGAATPAWNGATSEVDSAASTDLLVVYKGFSDPTVLGNRFDSPLTSGIHVDGNSLVTIGTTTGTVANGGTSLAVASATGAAAGRTVMVRAPSNTYSALITNVSGTTLTLDTAAPVAATGVEVDIGTAFAGVKGFGRQDVALQGAGLQLRDTALTAYPVPGLLPYLAQMNGSGSGYPFNRDDVVWLLGTASNGSARKLIIAAELRSQATPNSVTRSGTTVTVDLTSAGTGGARPGDSWIKVIGANEAGINGTWPIASQSGNTYTYTSDTSGSLTASGTIKVTVVRAELTIDTAVTYAFGSGGISYNSQSGVFQPLIPSTADGTMTRRGASATTGRDIFQFGSTYLNTSSPVFTIEQLTGSTPTVFEVTGAGGLRIGQRATPSGLPSLYLVDSAASDTHVLPQNDTLIYNNNGVNYTKLGSNAAVPLAQVQAGTTANRPKGWISGSTITGGGTNGTNGTFSGGISGGTCTTSPVFTFTVAGGAVTGITITDPGACSVVPTPTFTASSGLSGQSITLTLSKPPQGTEYFDTDLGKPVWLKTPSTLTWVDAAGSTV